MINASKWSVFNDQAIYTATVAIDAMSIGSMDIKISERMPCRKKETACVLTSGLSSGENVGIR